VTLLKYLSAQNRRERLADEHHVDALCWAWRQACIGAGLCTITNTVTGPTESVPHIVEIVLGPPIRLLVELLPGQIPIDVRAAAHRVAPVLGAVALRIEPRGLRHVCIELLSADPLKATSVQRARPVSSACQPVMLGRDEDTNPVLIDLAAAAHLIVQGASGSGKSVGVYGLLAQLADAPDVRVIGSDITGLTLGPWAQRPDAAGWYALGTRDPQAHIRVLERVVRIMDDRIADMPPGHDSIPITAATPLLVVPIEELPGLFRVLGTANKDVEKRARALVARLLGEGRKAAIRVLLITQRADASIIGGYERGQASHTISYRVDTLSALQMLHPDADKAIAAEHATATAGVALLTAPGTPLRRFRSPLTTYARYCAEVTGEAVTDERRAA
jgi:DNA segregation ATPase FtsK/SpoIIIE, S-DNA-T family